MEIRNFRAVDHQTIKANFNIYIEKWDLYLNKMTLINTGTAKFVSSPSEKYEKDGETKYFPYFAFGKDSSKKFQEKVMELLKPHLEKLVNSSDDANDQERHQPTQQDYAQDDLPF